MLPERHSVEAESFLPFTVRDAKIDVLFIVGFNCCLVCNTRNATVSVQRAVLWDIAIALSVTYCLRFLQVTHVGLFDYILDIGHAAIA